MARGNRKAAKPSASSTMAAKPSVASTSGSTTSLEPFVPAPPKLDALLSTLPLTHVYLTSIDTTSPSIKRNAFLVPIVLNTLIALGLAYRVYTIAPTYFSLIVTIFGYDTAARVDTGNAGMADLLGVVSSRTFLLMVDYALFTVVGAWPWQFLFGSKDNGYVGPAMWKWEVGGFREREVVVRRSRRWDKGVIGGEGAAKGKKSLTMDDALTLKLKIAPAMEGRYLEKTGYAMLDRDWDLDFAGMVNSYQLIESEELAFEDLQSKAFIYDPAEKKWLIWDIHKGEIYTPKTDEEKDIVEKFRDKLRAMGQEDLFYRWIELVQYESSVPGGFTEGRQAAVMRNAKQMFEEKGVDFAKFWDEIGGREGMPGLEG